MSGLVTLLLTAPAVLARAACAQQPAEPVPAPVVRVQRHPPAQTIPGKPSRNSPTTGLTAAPGISGHPSPAAPVVHRPRPVPSLLPDATPSTGTSPSTSIAPRHAVATAAKSATGQTVSPRSGAAASPPRSEPGSPKPASPAEANPAKDKKPSPEHPSNTIHGLNRNVVVIDPGHGGTDSGARIGDNTLEKSVTLALAFRLRSLLLARGFTVVLTRDSDAATLQATPNAAPTPLTLEDRAGIANHAHASACLLLHATGRGTGLHLYKSEIGSLPAEPYLVPWLTGQAAWVPASRALESGIGAALGRSGIRLLASTASVRPVDSLTCPALVLELAPENDTPASINDAGYQERVAAALAAALVVWENAVQPPPRLPAPLHLTHRTDTPEPPAAKPDIAAAQATPETQP